MATAERARSLRTDLRLEVQEDGSLDLGPTTGARTVTGKDNLVQALALRLIVGRGELSGVGHRRYGSRVYELVGEPLTEANLALLRRHARAALRDDPRVAAILSLDVHPRLDAPGALDIRANVEATTGDPVEVGVAIDLS